jgi:hypothetical protein
MDVREKLIELLRDVQYLGGLEEKVADHLIANGVTIAKWIPVTERLPEEPDRYLCNVKSFAFKGEYYQTILKYDKGGFIEGYIYTDDVTHWMSLPEPPKGE